MIHFGTTESDGRLHHYQPIIANHQLTQCLEPPFDESLEGIDAFIVSCDVHPPSRLAIAECKRKGIPTFHIVDGVIDWRTTFLNPKFDKAEGGIPLFRPLMCDHVFAMGPLQQSQFQWLGNNQVHATGFPRFDALEVRPCRVGACASRPRILVATANTPWVTTDQETTVVDQFRGLTSELSQMELDPTYRIPSELASQVNVTPSRQGSASEAILAADAVITTPSTFAVESMLMGVPTLIFDPFSLPTLTPSAWLATHYESVARQLPSLLAPIQERASQQDFLLRQCCRVDTKAADRIIRLIETVIRGDLPGDNVDAEPSDDSVKLKYLSGRKFTDQQLAGLEASQVEFSNLIGTLRRQLSDTMQAQSQPSTRFVVGTLFRYAKGLIGR